MSNVLIAESSLFFREMEEDSVFRHQKALHEFEEMNKEKEEGYKQTLEEKDTEIHSYQLKVLFLSFMLLEYL